MLPITCGSRSSVASRVASACQGACPPRPRRSRATFRRRRRKARCPTVSARASPARRPPRPPQCGSRLCSPRVLLVQAARLNCPPRVCRRLLQRTTCRLQLQRCRAPCDPSLLALLNVALACVLQDFFVLLKAEASTATRRRDGRRRPSGFQPHLQYGTFKSHH